MPCLNESKSLPACITKARKFLAQHHIMGEIIVADNGSTDGSAAVAESMGVRVVHAEQQGYGIALAAGIDAAQGRFIVMGDSDDTYDFGNLMPFLEGLRDGADLVMGNRFAGGIAPGAMPWLHRYVGNPLISWIGRTFFGSRCGDFYCGLRAFTKSAYQRMRLRSPGMEFALEMLIKATMEGMDVREVPTTLSPDQRDRLPHLRRWRDGWRSLRLFMLLSPKWLFWYPGVALFGIGLIGMVLLSVGPLYFGNVTIDYYTLLLAAGATIVGFQSASIAVCAKYSAICAGLHPSHPKFERRLNWFQLERAVLVGGVMGLVGLAGVVTGIGYRSAHEFGELVPGYLLRILILSVTLLILGIQIIFASLFLSMIRMYGDWQRRDPGESRR
jgi:glycosyltransferase involved in cell wall biosynthesis